MDLQIEYTSVAYLLTFAGSNLLGILFGRGSVMGCSHEENAKLYSELRVGEKG